MKTSYANANVSEILHNATNLLHVKNAVTLNEFWIVYINHYIGIGNLFITERGDTTGLTNGRYSKVCV